MIMVNVILTLPDNVYQMVLISPLLSRLLGAEHLLSDLTHGISK